MVMHLPERKPRLQWRYEQLVKQRLAHTDEVAGGWRALPQIACSFAAAQAAWRFDTNPRVNLVHLAQPLIASTRTAVAGALEGTTDEARQAFHQAGSWGWAVGVAGDTGCAAALLGGCDQTDGHLHSAIARAVRQQLASTSLTH